MERPPPSASAPLRPTSRRTGCATRWRRALLLTTLAVAAAGCASDREGEVPLTPEQIMASPDARMRSIILSPVEIQNAPLEEALRYLTEQSRQADPDKEGVTIVYRRYQLGELPFRVTLKLTHATVMQALEEVCRQTRCRYLITKTEVVVLSEDFLKRAGSPVHPRDPLFR